MLKNSDDAFDEALRALFPINPTRLLKVGACRLTMIFRKSILVEYTNVSQPKNTMKLLD
jgi:hypothetical protein